MNDIREIVTKAIVEKGKKTIRFTETVKTANSVESVLGCWVLNHHFQAEKRDTNVIVAGEFEVNIWASYDSNSKTEIVKQKIRYQHEVGMKRKVKEYQDNPVDVIVRMIQPPVCSDVKIVEDHIEIEVLLEVVAEVIGETKIRVSVLDQVQTYDPDDQDSDEENELDNKINPQFLREKMF